MIFTIAARELRSLFASPLAWCVLGVVQVVLGYLFIIQIWGFEEVAPRLPGLQGAPGITAIVVSPLFKTAAVVMLLVIPILSMRLLAEERRAATLTLLLSAPVSMTEIVLGKFFGLLGFVYLMIGMVCLMPLSLILGAHLDPGLFFSGLLALLLLTASFVAAGLFLSSLTSQPAVAAVATFGLLLLLWVLRWAGDGSTEASELFRYLSLVSHTDALLQGLFDTQDVCYYLLFIVTFLVLTVHRLDTMRLGT